MAVLKDFSTYTGIATFAVYLFGYLALRFHLTALGIVTELGPLDERYFFAGLHFLVFLAAGLPVLAILGLPLAALAWLVWRRIPRAQKLVAAVVQSAPLLLWTSAVLAVLAIRFWMSACLPLHDLPLAAKRPEPGWLFELLRSHNPIDLSLFFLGLLICAALVCAPLIAACRQPRPTPGLKALFATATVLAGITVLLLPVNFGVVVMPYSMERVAAIGKTPPTAGQRAWRLWGGKEWTTYFVQADGGRKLVLVRASEIDRIEVSENDSLFDVLYGGAGDRK
jgi:hypothetical protein